MAFLHGAVGNWDEVALLIGGFGVLWLAIRLAGRRAAADPDDLPDDIAPRTDPGPDSPP